MDFTASRRLQKFGGYAFADVDDIVDELKARGITPIDFGVGDPTTPTPRFIIEALQEAAVARASSGYPRSIGAPEFREEVARWNKTRFGVSLDPATEVSASIGSKEAVVNFHEAVINPGDVTIVPTPGYPPYTRGTFFAEGAPYYLPLRAENDFLLDLDAIPADVCKKAKLLWVNYPNSPTGKIAPPEYFRRVIEFGRKHNIVVASDEAYSEIYFTEKPHSILEYGRDGVVVFQSLSKRSAMTCYRTGWVAGDARIIAAFRKVKMNTDSGTPTFIQDAAVAALRDEKHVEEMREEYRVKRDIMVAAFKAAGLEECPPDGTIYIWQKCPNGVSSVDFAKALLAPEIAMVTTPGAWIGDKMPDGSNSGEGYIRLALVPTIEETKKAADRIRRMKF
jgi:LL-diaminopimelate aminotransferase